MTVDPGQRHVVLVGEMGTGKTSVGMSLAARLDMGFMDSDVVLEGLVGSTGNRIASQSGVEALHDLELRALTVMLDEPTPSVVAAAASVIDSAEGRRLLALNSVVWLTASPEVVTRRLGGPDHRRRTTAEERLALLERRVAFYESVADLRLDTDGIEPAEAADRIVTWLREDKA
jgi:shikimate kinase